MSETLDLACELIRRPSVTPDDAGCQALIGARLAALGFTVETLEAEGVTNLWATLGDAGPLLVFAGHTDVVPTGPEEAWATPPFEPAVDADGLLRGRGAADMKGSLAAMVTACEAHLAAGGIPGARIGFLLTSDEEGPALHGTRHVVEVLRQRGETIDWCIVGEPSATAAVGDTVKNGRRGSLSGHLVVHGRQGHVAYPQHAVNPVHRLAPALAELAGTRWDEGNDFFPPTTFQVSNLHAGTGATNVIPGDADVHFNFRFSTASTAAELQERTEAILDAHGVDYSLDWTLSGEPFLTEPGTLVAAVREAVAEVTGGEPELSTAGGTSDGRFIAPTGAQVVELGPVNATIHQVDERVAAADLDRLHAIHTALLRRLAPVTTP
ncbi:succinyl-diaminopimelate desuccinylase [Thiohalospira sp.]|uniref:succinyl-diaminopimelate desuccinylase n=1 Tax=Thiohalospira sp. TaxID=3080549 RepID=UPI003980AE13